MIKCCWTEDFSSIMKCVIHQCKNCVFQTASLVDVRLLWKSAPTPLKKKNSLSIHIVLFWHGDKSLTFHLYMKDLRLKTEVKFRRRSQMESCSGEIILSVLMTVVVPWLPPRAGLEGNNGPRRVCCCLEHVLWLVRLMWVCVSHRYERHGFGNDCHTTTSKCFLFSK